VLTNLVKNALKFTQTGSIELGYEKKDKFFEFFVKDTGSGIPQEQKEFIFERFRQGSESLTRGYEGAGLGLAISKAYVEILGGKIWIENNKEQGSTFRFTIPYLNEIEEKEQPPVIIEDEIHQSEKLKILVVEDDEISIKLLGLMIKPLEGEIFQAITGHEAVEVCRNNPDIDLVLMDIQMPGMNGYEATRQIREFNKDVVIIAQTAYALPGDRKKALEAGCNDHISKPIKQKDLLGLIEKHFKKQV
jgi:CheY-like chemotaxis protein